MSSEEFFSQVTEHQQHLYNRNSAFQHRRISSNTVNLVGGITGKARHRRTYSNTVVDFKLMFSGAPHPEQLEPFEEEEPLTPDSLSSVPERSIRESQREQAFLSLLEAAVTYFSTDETISAPSADAPKLVLRLRELEHSQEMLKNEVFRLNSALDEQRSLTTEYEEKTYQLTRNLIKLEANLSNVQGQLKLEKARNKELSAHLSAQNEQNSHADVKTLSQNEFPPQKKPIVVKHIGRASPAGTHKKPNTKFSLSRTEKRRSRNN